jgi:5-methylcytosine-specific restriction endonuclease McrA
MSITNSTLKRRKPLPRSATPRKRTERSKERERERAADNRRYAKVRRDVLECAPYCAVNAMHCLIHSTETHHIKSRAQGGKHEVANLLPVCRNCHRLIHGQPRWARERGFIEGTVGETT